MGKKRKKLLTSAPTPARLPKPLLFLAIIFVVALIPRLVFVIIARESALTYDEADYDMLARNLALGHGYVFWDHQHSNIPVTFRPPGYPFFISLVYRLFDGLGPYYYEPHMPAVFTMRIVQALLGALVPVLTFLIADRLFSRGVAKLAAAIMALYTTFIFFTAALMTENLYIPMLLVTVLLFLKSDGKRPYTYCAAGAVAMGCSVYIRPEFFAFLPFVLAWFYMTTRDRRTALKRWGVVAAIVVCMVAPWSVRNSLIADQPTFLDSRTGYNLYIGYHENANGTFVMSAAETLVNLSPEVSGKWGVIRDNWGRTKAWEFIREHPLRALALLPLKFMHFWDLPKREYLFAYSYGYIGALPAPVLALMLGLVMLPFAFVVTFAVAALAFTRPLPRGVWLLLFLTLFYTVGHTLVFGEPRMHMPLEPFLAVLAAQGLVVLPDVRRRWRAGAAGSSILRRQCGAAACAMIIFTCIWSYGLYLSWPKFQAVFGPNGHQSHIEF